jgi:hypothetical protein
MNDAAIFGQNGNEVAQHSVENICSVRFVRKYLLKKICLKDLFEKFVRKICSKIFAQKDLFENICSKIFAQKVLFENICSKN